MRHLLLIGLSHHTAPVALRERLDIPAAELPAAVASLAAHCGLSEAVVLSTCNRAEVYVSCAEPEALREQLAASLASSRGVSPETVLPHVYAKLDADAARHLFRVAAGLDSLVVGEPQILGQVKDAYGAAADQQLTGALLNRLFHCSFAVGKRVRAETGLSEGAVSVSYAALSLARKIFGTLRGRRVLLLGAGEMAKLTAVHLKGQQVERITVASRTMASAETLAAAVEGGAIPWTDVHGALETADILITAATSAAPILTRGDIEAAVRARANRPLFIIDIAVPRNVDPSAGDIEQVFLYNIDDLQTIVRENLQRRSSEIARADAIIAEEVDRFRAWVQSRDAIPTVIALRERFEAIRRAELTRLEPKLAGLSPEVRARVDEITHLIVEKLLLTPTEQLKGLADQAMVTAYADALSRLFSLEAEDQKARADVGPENGDGSLFQAPLAKK